MAPSGTRVVVPDTSCQLLPVCCTGSAAAIFCQVNMEESSNSSWARPSQASPMRNG